MDVLPDLLVPGLAVVFIGEAAGGESVRRGEYYADPRNTFWDDLYKSGVTDRLLFAFEWRVLVDYGVGLTDVVKHAADPELKRSRGAGSLDLAEGVTTLRRKIEHYGPWAACFMGWNSARICFGWGRKRNRTWGRQSDLYIGRSQIWLSPSTSGSARRSTADRRLILSDLYREVVGPWGKGHPPLKPE